MDRRECHKRRVVDADRRMDVGQSGDQEASIRVGNSRVRPAATR